MPGTSQDIHADVLAEAVGHQALVVEGIAALVQADHARIDQLIEVVNVLVDAHEARGLPAAPAAPPDLGGPAIAWDGEVGAPAPTMAGEVFDLVPHAPGLERLLPLFDARDPWQMSFGERTGLVAILDAVAPALAVEIGTCEGASLRRIAPRSEEVHSFDVFTPDPAIVAEATNATFHTGDSHVTLAPFLRDLADAGRNVDFALVDGDHTAEGARRDTLDLLESDAVGRTVILLHDTFNPEVRRGLEAVDYDAFAKVLHVELDWIPGHTFRGGRLDGESWGGLGLVVCDAGHPRAPGRSSRQGLYAPSAPRPGRVP